VRGRHVRSLLTSAGIGLGITAVVATVGLSASAAGSISDRFDALQATRVAVRYPQDGARPTPAAVDGVRRLNGVVGAGALCAAQREVTLSRLPPGTPGAATERASLVAAQPTTIAVLGARLTSGRFFDDGHGARRQPVAALDTTAARNLGVADATAGQQVFVDGAAFTVVGVFEPPSGDTRLTGAVLVPYEFCLDSADDTFAPPEVVIRTVLGAADQLSAEAPLALHPEDHRALVVLVPPDLRTFRQSIERDTQALLLGLAVVSLVIGAFGISNTTYVSVLERRAEIGLRRAVGASRRAVAAQFLAESGLLGLAGGLTGTVAGINITAAVAYSKEWLVVMHPGVVVAGPAVGAAIGMLAGLYPAYAAARVLPATTLRGE
jgi:putative ABC transport system permease protein